MTITEFLQARIADEEELANLRGTEPIYIYSDGVVGYADGEWDDGTTHLPNRHCDYAVLYDPARVLAECAAKRAIVELREFLDRTGGTSDWHSGYSDGNGDALKQLAVVYADHPDYDGTWKL